MSAWTRAAWRLFAGWARPSTRPATRCWLTPTPKRPRAGPAALLPEMPEAAVHSLVTEAISEQREIPNRAQQLADTVRRLRDQFIDRQLHSLAQRIGQQDLADTERIELLKQQQALRHLKRQPLA